MSRVRLTRFEQRWNEDESSSVHRETVAFTMRVKPRPLRKAAAGSSGGSSNPISIHLRTKSNYRKGKNPSRRKNRTMIPGWHMWRRHYRDSHLQACLLGHHDRLHMWRSENNVLGRYTSSIEKGRVYKIPKLTGKRIHVWGLVASSLLLHNFQFCKLGDIRAIRRP